MIDCSLALRFLNWVFTYNIFLTTHRTNMIEEMAYVIDYILRTRHLDFASIMCLKMIKAAKAKAL